ncbi:MAG: hypothetical protein GF331_23655, partial [Chitinivibrionales bacterium]|nr:hypothetical protein [Chitinivibrionales bacterium]
MPTRLASWPRIVPLMATAILAAWVLSPLASPLSGAHACAQYPPSSRTGAQDVVIDSFVQPLWQDGHLYVIRPKTTSGPLPVVAYLPGLGALYPKTNAALIAHTASRGFAVVYCPSEPFRTVKEQTFAVKSAIRCLRTAFDSLPAVLDTSRICFAGHSQGAGVVPKVAYRAITRHGWAHTRALLYVMAPWYLFGMTDSVFASFPKDAFLFVQCYADDKVNDHRIARHLYERVAIPPGRKRYMLVFTDERLPRFVQAEHSVPSTESRRENDVDQPVECCAAYPVFGTVLERILAPETADTSVFTDNDPGLLQSDTCAKVIEQVYQPFLVHPECYYLNFATHRLNPHLSFTSPVGMREPWLYASRVTIRNYKKRESESAVRYVESEGMLQPWPAAANVVFAPDSSNRFAGRGDYGVVYTAFPHSGWGTGTHHLFLPQDTAHRPPLIVLLHDLESPEPDRHAPLITHLVSRGNA